MVKFLLIALCLAAAASAVELRVRDGDRVHAMASLLATPEPQHALIEGSSEPLAGVLTGQIEKLRNAVVQILSTESRFNWRRPWNAGRTSMVSGSGFFVSIKNHKFILTNAHVVKQSTSAVIRIPALGEETFEVEIFAVCHDKDVALLRVSHGKAREQLERVLHQKKVELTVLTLGNSDDMVQGSVTVAVGYPLGQANLKFSTGILSGREHVESRFYMQTTAPINPGNSGGPLLNSNGEVMGINTAAMEKASNVGYAIPINHIQELLKSWVSKRRVAMVPMPDHEAVQRFPTLGVETQPVTRFMAPYLGYKGEGGVLVKSVNRHGWCAEAGVKVGDLLLSFNGHLLDRFGMTSSRNNEGSSEQLNIVDLAERVPIGKKKLTVRVWRDHKLLHLSHPFRPATTQPAISLHSEPQREGVSDYDVFAGVCVMPLTLNHVVKLHKVNPNLIHYIEDTEEEARETPRLVVTALLEGGPSPVERSGLTDGDIVKSVNGKHVNTLEEFRHAFRPDCFDAALRSNKTACYWTLQTESGAFFVLDFVQAVQNEQLMTRVFHYPASAAVRETFEYAMHHEEKHEHHHDEHHHDEHHHDEHHHDDEHHDEHHHANLIESSAETQTETEAFSFEGKEFVAAKRHASRLQNQNQQHVMVPAPVAAAAAPAAPATATANKKKRVLALKVKAVAKTKDVPAPFTQVDQSADLHTISSTKKVESKTNVPVVPQAVIDHGRAVAAEAKKNLDATRANTQTTCKTGTCSIAAPASV